ncbi:MAG: hypothetical protein ACFB0B_19380 [Thermonemataceae bacterium]
MRKLLLFILCSHLSVMVQADPYDLLSDVEVEQVKAHLAKHPYVLDYCDCCMYKEDGVVLLLEVTKLIVEEAPTTYYSRSDYPEGAFYVKAQTKPIGRLYFRSGQVDTDLTKGFTEKEIQVRMKEGAESYPSVITLNYTWGYDPNSQQATPLGTALAIAIEPSVATSGQCYPFTYFPKATAISNKKYQRWYKKNIQ